MKLIQFKSSNDESIWIDPERVISVCSIEGNNVLIGTGAEATMDRSLHLAVGSVDEIAMKINESRS